MFAGVGAGRKGVYILPDQETILVRLTIEDETEFVDHELLSLLFAE